MQPKVRWQEKEMHKGRAVRVARLEAVLIWNGQDPFSPENVLRLALSYRAKQAIPEATFRRWRKQEEAQMLVDQELKTLAERHGITADSVMQRIAALPEKMKTDSGLIEAIKMQGRLVQLSLDATKNAGSFEFRASHSLDSYTGPAPPLIPGKVTEASYKDLEDDFEIEEEA